MIVLMLGSHFRFREIVDPRNLKDSTANTVLLSMVRGGQCWGAPPEVHCHLHGFKIPAAKLYVQIAAGLVHGSHAQNSVRTHSLNGMWAPQRIWRMGPVDDMAQLVNKLQLVFVGS